MRHPATGPLPGTPLLQTILLLAAAIVTGCGGSGGGGGTPTQPPAASLIFTPESAGPQSVSLRSASSSTSSTLRLEVLATGFEDVYGVAFDLLFPANLLDFTGGQEGLFLSEEGAVGTSLQVVEQAGGRLIVGLTRLADVGGAQGDGVLMVLEFEAQGNGSGPISFDATEAVDPGATVLPDLTWHGGSVQVRL